ncbi:RNA polymerase sigma factor [Candidatus Parcubacteria bacterium]|nr:MAG: RNA polymerase sigma factor [Candidatus Parcubacteria bacterium]
MNDHIRREFIDAYDRHSEAIYRYSFFRVYSKSIAEEMVQETFIRVWKYMVKGNEIKKMRPFIYRICHNLIVDYHRRNAKQGKKEESLDLLMLGKNFDTLSYDGIDALEKKIQVQETLKAIDRMPPQQKQLLLLRYVEGLSPKEIGEIVDKDSKNVSAGIFRALKKFRSMNNFE